MVQLRSVSAVERRWFSGVHSCHDEIASFLRCKARVLSKPRRRSDSLQRCVASKSRFFELSDRAAADIGPKQFRASLRRAQYSNRPVHASLFAFFFLLPAHLCACVYVLMERRRRIVNRGQRLLSMGAIVDIVFNI